MEYENDKNDYFEMNHVIVILELKELLSSCKTSADKEHSHYTGDFQDLYKQQIKKKISII